MIYLIDANVLITAHNDYYPIDGVPEFWDWLLHQATIDNIKMPIEIYEEIKLYQPSKRLIDGDPIALCD